MKNTALKIISLICVICIALTSGTAVFAASAPEIQINMDSSGKNADISIKNTDMSLYSFQITLKTNNSKANYTLDCAGDNMYGTTTSENGNVVIYIDSTTMLDGKKEIKLARLSSDREMTIGSSADIILVDYSMQSIAYNNVKVNVSRKSEDSKDSSSGSSGSSDRKQGGAVIWGNMQTPNTPLETTGVFEDVDNSYWAKASIDYVTSKGLFYGTSDSTFEPTAEMTRAMYVTVISRFGTRIDPKWQINCDNPMQFDDVPDGDWFSEAVAWAGGTGLVSGMGENMFEPHSPVTREQIAVMTVNFAKLCGAELPSNVQETEFADEENIQYWASDAVHAAQRAGIINGRDDNTFAPQDTATRAEVAAIMHRFVMILN